MGFEDRIITAFYYRSDNAMVMEVWARGLERKEGHRADAEEGEKDERERWESIGASESYGHDRVGARGRREGKTGIGQDRQVAGRKRGK